MNLNKTLFIMALYSKPDKEFRFFEVLAFSTREAIEFFVDQMNEAFDRIYRNPDYDPNGPLMTSDSNQGRKNKADFEAEKEDYGPLYIVDFLEMNQIDWEISSIYSLTQIPEI